MSPGVRGRSGWETAPGAISQPVALSALPKAKHFLDRTLVLVKPAASVAFFI